ncbi:protein MONOCULM 1 [Typha angustifolia]|uniref:protein MONOCULM 1 n=1 Tax=Typha angustifolia TaxID=59011 RepID=UPI003C2F8513
MLSSLNSHEESEQDPDHHPHHPHLHRGLIASPSAGARQLLIRCAELIHRGDDLPAAHRGASFLLSAASPCGDSADRVAHRFARALSLRLDRRSRRHVLHLDDESSLQSSSYLSFNKITPFLRFAHLTANQAILDTAAADGRRKIHILDFDTAHGVQWPPLLQAIADRPDPPSIRITGTGPNLDVLLRTADRLHAFARSLNLSFQFHPLLLPSSSNSISTTSLQLQPGEMLAVNCVLYLHKLRKDELRDFLIGIKAMSPEVVAVAEREVSYSSSSFIHRFLEALDYYTAVFESLEATVPPGSPERLAVEEWLGREIEDAVASDEEEACRQDRLDRWEMAMKSAGFAGRQLSAFALSQAKLLLRLHYPSEGYQLQMVRGSFLLGWQNKPLFSLSSWH